MAQDFQNPPEISGEMPSLWHQCHGLSRKVQDQLHQDQTLLHMSS